jgi:proton glutamate symport protein
MSQITAQALDSKPRSKTPRIAAVGLLLFAAGAMLPWFVGAHLWISLLRWASLAIVAANAFRGQALTRWILFSMLLGGEIGFDWPQFAEHLRVFSDIFLRLIKVIVAPLIFGTLVTGIAGHGNLKSVGRIGLKSLIYFEIVTTLALLIGVAAINLTHAGNGLVTSPTATAVPLPNVAPLHWDEFLLHVFPENIAKSIADNQICKSLCLRFCLALRWRGFLRPGVWRC